MDPSRFVKKSKFDSSLDEAGIFNILNQTLRHGEKTIYEGSEVFTKRIRMGSKTQTFRATVNPDGTIQTFHPLG